MKIMSCFKKKLLFLFLLIIGSEIQPTHFFVRFSTSGTGLSFSTIRASLGICSELITLLKRAKVNYGFK